MSTSFAELKNGENNQSEVYWKSVSKKAINVGHRVCEIPAHFVRHTQTQAVCVWSKWWVRISVGLRWVLDSCRWRRHRNYHSLMSPIASSQVAHKVSSIINGEHGSVLAWDDYSTHAGDAGVVIISVWCRRLTQQSGGAQLLSIVDHQLVQYTAHSRTIGFAVLLALHRFYCFISNISATTQF